MSTNKKPKKMPTKANVTSTLAQRVVTGIKGDRNASMALAMAKAFNVQGHEVAEAADNIRANREIVLKSRNDDLVAWLGEQVERAIKEQFSSMEPPETPADFSVFRKGIIAKVNNLLAVRPLAAADLGTFHVQHTASHGADLHTVSVKYKAKYRDDEYHGVIDVDISHNADGFIESVLTASRLK